MTDRFVYDEIAPDLMRYATVLVGPDHAPGVVSAVVARALLRPDGLDGLDSPRAHLMKAILDEGVNRRRFHRQAHPTNAVDGGFPEVDVEVGNVDHMVEDLPPRQRAAAYLVIYLTHSPSEAAELMGKRSWTIRRYLKRARRQLDALGDDRIKEVFTRITASAPDAPAVSALDNGETAPGTSIRNRAWIWVAGAAALVLMVAGAFGLLDGDDLDLAAPDEALIDYVRLEYSASVNPVCEGGEIIDNGGFDEAIFEIWGPNSDGFTLMVATFPDGSTERTIVEGAPGNPDYIWVEGNPEDFPSNTNLRVVSCEGSVGAPGLVDAFSAVGPEAIIPYHMLGPPAGFDTFNDAMNPQQEPKSTEWNGNAVLLYEFEGFDTESGTSALNLYVTEDDRRALRVQAEQSYPGLGDRTVDYSVVEVGEVPADSVSFSKSGLTAIAQGFAEPGLDDCPVTVPSQAFNPPDTHPPTPSDPDMVWFGKDELWTALSTDGISEERKGVWWSANFTDPGIESSPDITVTYTLLNSATPLTIVNDQGTNASTPEDGLFIIAGSEPDIEGCWQVTAIYKDASLSYIYYNPEGEDPAAVTTHVPNVIGMTVEFARVVLEDDGLEASVSSGVEQTDVVCEQDPAFETELSPGSRVVKLGAAPDGECPEPTTPSSELNPDYETYTDDLGRQWYRTGCPDADVMISGGVDAVDGLPRAGDTGHVRIGELLEQGSPSLDITLVRRMGTVPRGGEVWHRAENGEIVVFSPQDDYMIEVVVHDAYECPSAPHFWNGIPIAYVRLDMN